MTEVLNKLFDVVIRIMAPKKSTRTNPDNPVDPAIAQILDLLRQQTANLTQQQQQFQQQQQTTTSCSSSNF